MPNNNPQLKCSKCGKKKVESKSSTLKAFFWLPLFTCSCPHKAHPGSMALRKTTLQRKKLDLEKVAEARLSCEQSLREGTIIGGNYQVIEKIGQGGMGLVLRVAHKNIGTHYALKVLSPELISEETWLRFQSEARIMGALSHPTFVKVYDLGLHNNVLPFYSMDLLQGISLESEIIERGFLSLHDTITIFMQVLEGLAYAHGHGVIHRDLKPSNFMLCWRDGVKNGAQLQVKILDFGIAKSGNKQSYDSQALTRVGDIFGSPCYMSPEQAMGEKVDARSDIYSIGCSIFETLTGYVPFDGGSSGEICQMHMLQEPPSLSEMMVNPTFPPSIEFVVRKCLAKRPSDRYQTVRELALDLQRIREGKDVLSYRRNTFIGSQTITGRAFDGLKISAVLLAVSALLLASYLFSSFPSFPDSGAALEPAAVDDSKQIKSSEAELGLADLSSGLSPQGAVAVLRTSESARLFGKEDRADCGLSSGRPIPVKKEYILWPADTRMHYLDRIKDLPVTGLQLAHIVSDTSGGNASDASLPGAMYAEPAAVKAYCSRVGQVLPISQLTIMDSDGVCKDLLHRFPHLNKLVLLSIELSQIASAADIAFLNEHLQCLEFMQMKREEPFAAALVNARKLRWLKWETPELSEKSINDLAAIKCLEVVDIRVGRISPTALHDLLSLPSLKRLSVNYRPGLLAELCSSVKPGRTLALTVCGIDSKAPALLAELKAYSGYKPHIVFNRARI